MDHRTYRRLVKPTKLAEQRARRLRKNLSPPEVRLWCVLRDDQIDGLTFRPQHAIGNYIADFYCRRARMVIEIDGQSSHRDKQLQHDKARDHWMKSCGIYVLRVQARDVFQNLHGVIQTIRAIAAQRITEIHTK
ncbi:MAG: endonuclease domain-containing protein [Phycisphaerales bacterium JB052]